MSTLALDRHTFDPRAAGTLLADFDRLLELIGDRGLPLSPKHAFAASSLDAINQRLAKPVRRGLKRTMQKSYPVIGGLSLLMRASGLGQINAVAKPPRLVLDPRMMSAWSALNDTERYFALLKAWWGRGNNAMIGERTPWNGDLTAQVIDFAERCLIRGCPRLEHPDEITGLKYRPGFVNLALLELFGLFEIQVMPPEEGQGWRPDAIALTPWGHHLADPDQWHDRGRGPRSGAGPRLAVRSNRGLRGLEPVRPARVYGMAAGSEVPGGRLSAGSAPVQGVARGALLAADPLRGRDQPRGAGVDDSHRVRFR
jgi:hypothetical protein